MIERTETEHLPCRRSRADRSSQFIVDRLIYWTHHEIHEIHERRIQRISSSEFQSAVLDSIIWVFTSVFSFLYSVCFVADIARVVAGAASIRHDAELSDPLTW